MCVPTGEMAESRAKRVRIKEMDGWTLGLLVDYIYTAEIQVTEDNVQVNTHTFILTEMSEYLHPVMLLRCILLW